MNVKTWRMAAACLVAASMAVAAGAAERPYDRDVAKLVDLANKGLNRFVGNMKGDARGAKVKRDGVEYDVSDFLDDLKAEGARLDERFRGDQKAEPTALAFLQKAKGFDGFIDRNPGFSGADREWEALRPTLASLADAYGIDWKADSASWQARRASDAEMSGWAKQLDADIKAYAGALAQAGKEAKVDKAGRAGLDEQVKSLQGGAKTLQKTLSAKSPAGNAIESLLDAARGVDEQAAKLGLGDAASEGGSQLQATLQKLSEAVGG